MTVQFTPATQLRLIGDYDKYSQVVRDAQVVVGTLHDGKNNLQVALPVHYFKEVAPGKFESFQLPSSSRAFLPFGQPQTLDLIG